MRLIDYQVKSMSNVKLGILYNEFAEKVGTDNNSAAMHSLHAVSTELIRRQLQRNSNHLITYEDD